MRFALVLGGALLGACGSRGIMVDQPVTTAVGGCDGMETLVPSEAGIHVDPGTPITWSSNPPATGEHYPVWAQFDRQYTALDRGYWLHDAEHGAIVLLYNCPTGCPDIVAGLVGVVQRMAVDHGCVAPVQHRAILAADPLLPTTVGAVAWDVSYTATCVDPYLDTFARVHYAQAPEDFCSDGANLGGTPIAP